MARSRLFSAVRSSTSQRLISDGTTSTARVPRFRAARCVAPQSSNRVLPRSTPPAGLSSVRWTGVLAIGQHAVGQPVHAARDLALKRLLELARTCPGFEGCDLGNSAATVVRRRGAWI